MKKSYELILRPRSAEPVARESLRQQLLLGGLRPVPDSVRPGWLADERAFFEIVAAHDLPAGWCVIARIPVGLMFFDVTLELLNLERLACAIRADVVDGGEVMIHSGAEGLAALLAFHSRYERASKPAARTTLNGTPPGSLRDSLVT